MFWPIFLRNVVCLCICYTHVTIVNLPERLCLPNYACFYVVSLCKVGSILPTFISQINPLIKCNYLLRNFSMFTYFPLLWKTEQQRGRKDGEEREIFHSLIHPSVRAGPGQRHSLELHVGVPLGGQDSSSSTSLLSLRINEQEARSEAGNEDWHSDTACGHPKGWLDPLHCNVCPSRSVKMNFPELSS